jgi:thiol-disulfide isomerase/thioredoxin
MAIAVHFLRIIAGNKSNPMQKFLLAAIFVIMLSLSNGYSQNRSIHFIEKPWQEIVAQARTEKKLIFLDAFASWCGPCKWMSANMFTRDSIADYYNKTFICASFDMEKGEGRTLAKKYGIRAYPSLLFINSDEGMVHERVGAPQKVKDYLEMAVIAQNPDECLAGCIKKYRDGDISPRFIQDFLVRLSEAYIPVNDVLKKYFATQNESDMLNRSNWNIIYRYISEMNDPVFEFLVSRQKEYARLYSKDSVYSKISDVYYMAYQQVMRNPNQKQVDSTYLSIKQKISASGFEDAGKVNFTAYLNLYQMRGNNKDYLDLAYNGTDRYLGTDYSMLNNVAWQVSSLTTDVKYLQKALSWSTKSIALKREPSFLDTNASILFKLGRKDDAIKQEKEASDLAKKMNLPFARYDESVKRMEGSK